MEPSMIGGEDDSQLYVNLENWLNTASDAEVWGVWRKLPARQLSALNAFTRGLKLKQHPKSGRLLRCAEKVDFPAIAAEEAT